MIPPLGHLGLFEYRLSEAHEPIRIPDLSMPLPDPKAVAQQPGWEQLQPLLALVNSCLRQWPDLLADPWLEFDQPGEGWPGLFLRLQRPATQGELAPLAAALGTLLDAPPLEPLATLPLPTGVRISHLGLFPPRLGQRHPSWRCNLVGPAAAQWGWLQQQLPAAVALLQRAGVEPLLLAQPGQLAWSACFDWYSTPQPRLGLELYPTERLQRGSGEADPAALALLELLTPWCPHGSLERTRQWHRRRLGERFQPGFSHLKLVANPNDGAGDGTGVQLKLYLLAHAPV
ncbi:MAG: hypothetical protein RLZZ54_1248 [Cyanobacteriota bacterium]